MAEDFKDLNKRATQAEATTARRDKFALTLGAALLTRSNPTSGAALARQAVGFADAFIAELDRKDS